MTQHSLYIAAALEKSRCFERIFVPHGKTIYTNIHTYVYILSCIYHQFTCSLILIGTNVTVSRYFLYLCPVSSMIRPFLSDMLKSNISHAFIIMSLPGRITGSWDLISALRKHAINRDFSSLKN